MFWVVFLSRGEGDFAQVLFVASNCLCVRELLNVLAAKGEQGEVVSDWYTGGLCTTVLCVTVLAGEILWCVVHVWGGFCGRGWCFEVLSTFLAGFVDGVVFWCGLSMLGR